MNNIAVIMTVHNRCEKTLKCLNSLCNQRKYNFTIKVFITDDGCTDNTVPRIKELYPEFKIISGDGTLYWNRGMLKAWKTASIYNPDYYLWLNDDTILFDNAIEQLLKSSVYHNNKAIIVGSTCDNFGNITYGGRKANMRNSIIQMKEEEETECQTFNGNIVLIPNNVYNKLGYNDSYFHHSFGDIEYGLRANRLGIKNIIAPGFLGICEKNNPIPIFRRKCYPIIKRYKLLYSPLGYNPKEDFYLTKKYHSICKAILRFIKLHLNVLFAVDHTKFNNK